MYQTTAWPAAAPQRTVRIVCHFDQVPKLSATGVGEVRPLAFMLANSGDSRSRSRMKMEIPTRTTDSRNGTRQPQALQLSAGSAWRTRMITSSERKRPRVAVVWMKAV